MIKIKNIILTRFDGDYVFKNISRWNGCQICPSRVHWRESSWNYTGVVRDVPRLVDKIITPWSYFYQEPCARQGRIKFKN